MPEERPDYSRMRIGKLTHLAQQGDPGAIAAIEKFGSDLLSVTEPVRRFVAAVEAGRRGPGDAMAKLAAVDDALGRSGRVEEMFRQRARMEQVMARAAAPGIHAPTKAERRGRLMVELGETRRREQEEQRERADALVGALRELLALMREGAEGSRRDRDEARQDREDARRDRRVGLLIGAGGFAVALASFLYAIGVA